jgi:mono/diheme cytochrome c family protein
MKRPGYWVCLGAVAVLGLAACGGEDGGEDVVADTYVPDIVADTAPDDPGTADPGTVDPGAPDAAEDPGESPDTIEPEDPGAQPDTPATDAPDPDAAEDVVQPASRACIGCHTNKAILEELAPDDGEPAGGGG